ncbi:hypothetical protein [Sorangium sp. So ce124]|uniref:hypothetical protein n=1 Tax=Sorangium sp. So ce124 TaxID=3133280 RepID=UPI003F5D93A2
MLLFLLALLGCSVPDDDASGRVRAWLESLDPDADVVEVRCTGNLEEPPGSGTWTEYERVDRWTSREVLGAFKVDGVDWAEVVARCISNSEYYFPKWLLGKLSDKLSAADRVLLKMSFHVDEVRCHGTPLRSPPPTPVRSCPNDIDGCDDAPPMASDLPPPLPPPGGGDF